MVNNGQRDKTRLGTVQDFLKNLKIQCISHCVGITLYSSIMQMNAVVWYWHSIIISNISLWAISVISKTNQLWFLTMGYSRKIQKGRGRGLKTWNFQGYWKNRMWKFQVSIKKEVEFVNVIKKKSFGIFMGRFWYRTFQFGKHNFVEFPGVKTYLVWNLKR